MSWKHAGAFKAEKSFTVPKPVTKPTKVVPTTKDIEFKRVETEIS